jgi:hypothetical protein
MNCVELVELIGLTVVELIGNTVPFVGFCVLVTGFNVVVVLTVVVTSFTVTALSAKLKTKEDINKTINFILKIFLKILEYEYIF